MTIVDARWTPVGNVLKIRCGCGRVFGHRADRWWAHCPECDTREHMQAIREREQPTLRHSERRS